MAQNTFNLSEEQLVIVTEALVGLYPIPTTEKEVTTSAGTETESVPAYDVEMHPEVCVKNWIEQQVMRWEGKKAKEALKAQAASFNLTLNSTSASN